MAKTLQEARDATIDGLMQAASRGDGMATKAFAEALVTLQELPDERKLKSVE